MKFKISSRISVPGIEGKTLPTPSLGMWVTAIWPYHTGILSAVNLVFVLMNLITTIIGEGFAASSVWGDIPLFCIVLSTTLTGCHSVCKIVYFRFRQKSLKNLVERFYASIWKSDNEDPKIFEETENKIIFSNIFSLCMVSSLSLYCTLPFFDTLPYEYENKLFPFLILFPFEIRVPILYEIFYLQTVVAGFYAVACILGHDTILNYFLIYSCKRLNMIQDEMLAIGNLSKAEERLEEDDKEISETFGSLVNRHCIVIGFINDMEDLFSPSIFIQFCTASVFICIIGIQLVFLDLNLLAMVKTFLFLSSIVGQLFINCFTGQQLIDCSLKIADAAYSINWTDLNKNIHKNVVIIIHRSQEPLQLTAYKFFSLSMESFSSVCSSAGSYFALCKTLIED